MPFACPIKEAEYYKQYRKENRERLRLYLKEWRKRKKESKQL